MKAKIRVELSGLKTEIRSICSGFSRVCASCVVLGIMYGINARAVCVLGGGTKEATGAGGVTAAPEGGRGPSGSGRGAPQARGEEERRGREKAKGRIPQKTGDIADVILDTQLT